jgi:hypothetical protein
MACDRQAVYRRNVIAAGALAGACLLIVAAGLAWAARLLRIGRLDAYDLAAKLAVPEPSSALDWPELNLRAVIPQPDEPTLVLLLVEWPAHRERAATLLVDVMGDGQRSLSLLSQWCGARASVSPMRRGDSGLELRRRQSLDRVSGYLLAEDAMPASSPAAVPRPDGG